MAPLESADVVLENTRDPRSLEKFHENRHAYTERIGYFCFGCKSLRSEGSYRFFFNILEQNVLAIHRAEKSLNI